jgi:hypothetical protein
MFSKKKFSNIEFHENPSSGRRVVPCGWTDTQTYMKKLILAFRNFASVPKNDLVHVERVRTEPQHAAVHNTRASAHSQILDTFCNTSGVKREALPRLVYELTSKNIFQMIILWGMFVLHFVLNVRANSLPYIA